MIRSRQSLRFIRPLVILSTAVCTLWTAGCTRGDNQGMTAAAGEFGRPNPDAPRELEEFAFLIGEWRCDIRIRAADDGYETHEGSLVARYTLDGYAIVDEFRQIGPSGELVRFGATYRSYNKDTRAWVMRWHDALNSTWLELGPEDLGGVHVEDDSITFKHRYPPNGLVRIRFSNISADRFTWSADLSTDDGVTWTGSVMVMKASRVN